MHFRRIIFLTFFTVERGTLEKVSRKVKRLAEKCGLLPQKNGKATIHSTLSQMSEVTKNRGYL